METLSNLAFGLGVALSGQNLLYCFIGCFLGTLVGVLPGIGPVATVAMLLPFTFGLGPAPALIMLAGIYYGAQYGGSTTAILVNIPGESSSVVTTLDGHQMARRGRAGPGLGFVALAMAFFGITDVVLNLEHKDKQEVFTARIGSVLPTAEDLRICFWSIVRGTGLGSLLGILPGGGALLASFAAYMVEKKVAKPPRSFGEG